MRKKGEKQYFQLFMRTRLLQCIILFSQMGEFLNLIAEKAESIRHNKVVDFYFSALMCATKQGYITLLSNDFNFNLVFFLHESKYALWYNIFFPHIMIVSTSPVCQNTIVFTLNMAFFVFDGQSIFLKMNKCNIYPFCCRDVAHTAKKVIQAWMHIQSEHKHSKWYR